MLHVLFSYAIPIYDLPFTTVPAGESAAVEYSARRQNKAPYWLFKNIIISSLPSLTIPLSNALYIGECDGLRRGTTNPWFPQYIKL